MDRRTQGALLLAVGGVGVRLGVTDAALTYIRPGYRPLLALAGAVIAVLGGIVLAQALRAEAHAATGERVGDHGHDHGRGPAVGWLLALPIFAILLIAPPPLGAFAAARQSGVVQQAAPVEYPPLPPAEDGAVPLTLGQYTVRALYDPEESLSGARVRLIGFVSEAAPDGTWTLTRFQLACCAADGTAISVEVRGVRAPPVDQWVRLEGSWQPREGHEPGELTVDPPVVVADQVTPIDPPDEPYEL